MKWYSLTYLILPFIAFSCGQKSAEENVKGKESKVVVAENAAVDNDIEKWTLAAPDGMSLTKADIDTMSIGNPFVRYERKSNRYYMVGDGGYMWISKNLKEWEGPYNVLDGKDNALADGNVAAPEIHLHDGRYYYMASLERTGANGEASAHCVVLVSDSITGPYKIVDKNSNLLEGDGVAAAPAYATDELGAAYMIYAKSDGKPSAAVEIVRLTDDLGRRMGEPYKMLRSTDESLLALNGKGSGQEIASPFVFVTDEGNPGMLFTTMLRGESVIGVAYSKMELGHWLNGPWIVENEPFVSGNVGGASVFEDYDGTSVMMMHKDTLIGGKRKFLPRMIKVDTQFDKLKKKGFYIF